MRRVLVHDYDMIRLDIVWRTIEQNLPPLVAPLEHILKENPRPSARACSDAHRALDAPGMAAG